VNAGRVVAGGLVMLGLVAGVAVWWLQEYAFYEEVAFQPGAEILLTPIASEVPEAIIAEGVTGIDADSSPLRFRACFTTPLSQAMLTETYRVYADPTPLNAPSWFDCFDAAAIGAALQSGEALAFLSQAEIRPGVDRVVAVFADGRAFAWHQLNGSLEN
jgi:hypothetical protein